MFLRSGSVAGSWPEHNGCSKRDGGGEDLGAPVAGRGNPLPVPQPPEHDPDPVAAFMADFVVLYRLAARRPPGMVGMIPRSLPPLSFDASLKQSAPWPRSASSQPAFGKLPGRAAAPA